jgi:hypothetical protein
MISLTRFSTDALARLLRLHEVAKEASQMRKTRWACTALVVILISSICTPAPRAQSKPNFSGTWTMDEARSVSPHYPGYVGPVSVVITQTTTDMTISTTRGGKKDVVTYRIVENEGTPAQATATETIRPPFKAYWNGLTLVSEVVRDVPSTVRSKEVRTLSEDGQVMTVETTTIVDHGYTEAKAQTYGTGKDVFTKVS